MAAAIQNFIEHYGLVAVFIGCVAEGESAAIVGGYFAHRHVLVLAEVIAVAAFGAALGDVMFFLIGRRFSTHPRVRAMLARPGIDRVHGFIRRHPDLFVLANRYLYGMRVAGAISCGFSGIALPRFLVLNALSALVWALVFVSFGYAFGLGIEAALGGALLRHHHLWIGLALGAVAALAGAWIAHRRARRGVKASARGAIRNRARRRG